MQRGHPVVWPAPVVPAFLTGQTAPCHAGAVFPVLLHNVAGWALHVVEEDGGERQGTDSASQDASQLVLSQPPVAAATAAAAAALAKGHE